MPGLLEHAHRASQEPGFTLSQEDMRRFVKRKPNDSGNVEPLSTTAVPVTLEADGAIAVGPSSPRQAPEPAASDEVVGTVRGQSSRAARVGPVEMTPFPK